MPPRQKRKAKSTARSGQETTVTQPEPQQRAYQAAAPHAPAPQAEPDPPPPELQAEARVESERQEEQEELYEAEKKKKLLTALTREQEEEMMEWLSEHPILWNKKMRDYKDIGMKDVLWRGQAEKMNKDVKELQVWYKSLRTRYGRLKKVSSGSGAQEFSERDKWILEKLEFLRPHIADVPKRTPVSFRAKMGLQHKTEVQACIEEDDTDQPPPLRPAASAQSSETPIETTPSSNGSVTSARPQGKREEQEREIYKLQQQLLDYFKKSQPTQERDCYADWLRSVFHSFDNLRFRRCQREISRVVFKYQELNENQPQIAPAPAPAPSAQALRSPMEQPDGQQTGTSQHQQMCGMEWQPHPLTWPSNGYNPHVSVWGSQDVKWVQQQQQFQQQVRPVSPPNPAITFSSQPHHGGSQEYDCGASLNACTSVVEREQQHHTELSVSQQPHGHSNRPSGASLQTTASDSEQ